MPYNGRFHRLVAIGDLYGDQFNFSLSIVPSGFTEDPDWVPEVTPTIANAVAAVVDGWFNNAISGPGMAITPAARLTSVKLNRIGTDGKYVDPETQEVLLGTSTIGGGSEYPAAQLACVVSLLTDVERGRASKGRFYVPPVDAFNNLASDGRLTAAQALSLVTGAKSLIDGINDTYESLKGSGAFDSTMWVGVASNAGAGLMRRVSSIGVGRVPDTMRSRRKSLIEDRVELPIPVA